MNRTIILCSSIALVVACTPPAPQPIDISLSRSTLQNFPVGGACSLQATSSAPLTWSSQNPAIATVDANGKIQAVGVGSTQITVSANAVSQRSLEVSVVDASSATLQLSAQNSRISSSDIVPIRAAISNLTCAEVTFTTTAGSISSDGLLTAPSSAGNITVTARATTGSLVREATLPLEVAFWSPSGSLPNAPQLRAMHASPNGEVYAASDNGMLRFDANTETWVELRGVRGGLENLNTLSLDFDSSSKLFVGTNSRVFSQNSGSTSFVATPSYNGSGTYTNGLPEGRSVLDLLMVGNTLYAALESWSNAGNTYSVFKLENNIWSPLPPLPETNNAIALTTLGGDIVASVQGGGIYRHSAGTWTLLSSAKPSMGSLQSIGNTIYGTRAVAGDNGVFKLENGAWTLERGGFPLGQLHKNGSDLLWANAKLIRRQSTTWAGLGGDAALPLDARHIAVSRDGRVYVSMLDTSSNVWQVWRSPKNTVPSNAPSVNVTAVSISPSSVAMRKNTFQPLLATVQGGVGVVWLSSDNNVVRVSGEGVLEGVGVGSASITAISRDNPSLRQSIVVSVTDTIPQVQKITLNGETQLEVGASTTLRAQLETGLTLQNTEPDRRLTWTSSTPTIATVSSEGVVSGVAAGSTTIRATSQSNNTVFGEIVLNIVPAVQLSGGGEWQPEALLPTSFATPNSLEFRRLVVHGTRLYASIKNNGTWSRPLNTSTWRRETIGAANLPDGFEFASSTDALLMGGNGGRVFALENGIWRELNIGVNYNVTQVLIVGSTWYAGVSADTSTPARVFKLENSVWNSTGGGLGMGNDNSTGALVGLAAQQNSLYAAMSNGYAYKLENGAWNTLGNQRLDNSSNPIRHRDLAVDDAGNVYVSDGGIAMLPIGSNKWRNLYGNFGATNLEYTGRSLLMGGDGNGFELRLPSLELVRLSGTSPFTGKSVRSVVLDGVQNTIYAGINFGDTVNVYRIQQNPSLEGSKNDLPLTTSSYLGASGGDNAFGADIQPDGGLVMGGRLERTDLGQTAVTHLLGGGTGSVVRLSFDGSRVLSLTRIGDQIYDLEVNRSNGQIAIIGDFGVAVLSSDAKTVVWSAADPSTDESRRIAIGSDGTVATLTEKQIRVYSATGSQTSSRTLTNSFVLDLALDSQTQSVFVTGMDNKKLPPDNTLPGAPVQVAYLYAYGYDLGNRKWTNWNYSGLDLNGQEADTRGYRVAMGRDNKLYFLGENAGGNSIFRWDPRSPIGTLSDGRKGLLETTCNCWVQYDQFNQPFNTAAPHFAYYARLEPSTGTVLKGQFIIPRLPNTKSNTFRVRAIAADEAGHVVVGGISAFGIENRTAKRVAGQNSNEYGGADLTVFIASSDLNTRIAWHPLNQSTSTDKNGDGIFEGFDGGRSEATAVAASRGRVFYSGNAAAGRFVTTPNALQAAPSSDLGQFDTDAYFAVIPLP